MYKIICVKKVQLVKNILIILFQKIDNLIVQDLLSAIDLINSSAEYKN